MAITDTMTKVNLDSSTDDPKLGRGDLVTNVDIYNALAALLKTVVTLNLGDGVASSAGNLVIDLAANPGLEFTSGAVKVKTTAGLKLTTSGLELDIVGLTQDSAPDLAADFLLSWDVSAVAFKKVLAEDVGGGGGGWVLLEVQSPNAAASVVFNTGIDTTYSNYKCIWEKAAAQTNNVSLQVDFSTNGGSSYLGSGNLYTNINENSAGTRTVETGNGASGPLVINKANSYALGAPHGNGWINLTDPADAGGFTNRFQWRVHHGDIITNGFGRNGTATINAFRIKFSSGTLSGTFRLYGLTSTL